MDWSQLLRLPATGLLIAAGMLVLLTLVQLFAVRACMGERRALAAGGHGVLGVVCLLLAALALVGGLALRGYRLLPSETPVVEIESHILSPQRWALTLTWPDGSARREAVSGDAWRLEAVVLKWRLPTVLAGMPPLYRLDRLSGRYDDVQQERTAPRSVVDLARAGSFDVLDLRRQYPQWLGMVDAVYGSGVYLPLVDQGHYSVSLMRTGALVARPDATTAERIGRPLGD